VGGVVNVAANWDNIDGFWQVFTVGIIGAVGGVIAATGGASSYWALAGVSTATGAVVAATNDVVAQTGKNFEGMEDVDWGQVGKSSAVGGVSGLAAGSAGYWAAGSTTLVNNVNSPLLRSVIVSPIASGAGHVAGGTTYGLLEGKNINDSFYDSFDGIGKSMAIGTGVGVTSTIATSYAMGINPINGKSTVQRFDNQKTQNQTYEVGDGVRRVKAAWLLGKENIMAEDYTGRQFEVPIKDLRFNVRDHVNYNLDTRNSIYRFDRIYYGIKFGNTIPSIYVSPGSRGVDIYNVNFR
jgi:hypothetical protein